MTEGTVKFFDATKHFGFINGDDSKSYYFHATQVEGHVTDGDRVSFTPAQAERGPKAENVARVPNTKKARPDQEELPESGESEEPGDEDSEEDEDSEPKDEDSEEADVKKTGEDEGSPE